MKALYLAVMALLAIGWSVSTQPAAAQGRTASTAEDVFANAQSAYGPPPPEPKCDQGNGDEIVVCAEQQEQSQFRVKSTSELDPESDEALDDGLPRAPDFAESCKKNPEKGTCISFGSVPPPAYLIDFSKLPETPKGSDADRIANGLAPRGNDTGAQSRLPNELPGETAREPASEEGPALNETERQP
ncbi:hypothetical protein [Pontixanthobacter luteolus]|uniref:hypothetical protein n=1 Tax=Pontixanthobacter luteolus TaxID=295089 RepID=UPI0023041DAB|nr:hypothetical protein [Pontixanthobacter luteolus]